MLYTRQQLEAREDQMLASYAIRSMNSKGRKFADVEPEYRTRFQRDRDRILHTTAYRRLEYKTQVFIFDEGDYYRTRLTHTLEVSQIGRTIARALGVNEDLTEAICMAHDLGHPPFGHSGEAALSRLMSDFGGFNHNQNSYRIVTELEHRFPNFPGLNLSWEVLEGIVKHETEYDRSEVGDFNPELRGHLEAQIANVADELAYTAHDLDDGLRSEVITPSMLEGIELWEMLVTEACIPQNELDEICRHILIRTLIGMEVDSAVHTTELKLRENNIKTVDDIQRLPYNLVSFSEDMYRRNRQLKDFLYTHMYRHYRVVRMAMKAERIVSDLFLAYQREASLLPNHIQARIDETGLERTICDYIAGMTDRYAIEEHGKLFEPGKLP
jgi:dGTPase